MSVLAVGSRAQLATSGYDVELAEEGVYIITITCHVAMTTRTLRAFGIDVETADKYFIGETLGAASGDEATIKARFSMPPGIYELEIISPRVSGHVRYDDPIFPLPGQLYRFRIDDLGSL